ncbi:MAG: ABC transporter ATP-binding protein [Opitutus sp.]
MASMVELRGVTKRFGSFTAVNDVSLSVMPGEFLTLLGPSGCGKTTLLRMIAGFERPDQGTVWLDGTDVTDSPPYRRNVNQVFQSYALFPHLSVRDNIGFGLRMQKLAAAECASRIEEAVSLVALEGLEDRKPDQLSGGQRQRVALARALAPRPAVLLLDEPLSALDAQLRRGMQLELKRLQRQLGVTFIFVTHDQEEALTMSDRIAIVNRGRIEQLGTTDEIYHRPVTAFAAEFIGQANVFDVQFVSAAADGVRVRTNTGLQLLMRSDRWPQGKGKGRLSLRPEKVHVAKEPIPAETTFPAIVEEKVFKGSVDHLRLRLPEGSELLAIVANQSALIARIHRGDQVYCCVHPEDFVVLGET